MCRLLTRVNLRCLSPVVSLFAAESFGRLRHRPLHCLCESFTQQFMVSAVNVEYLMFELVVITRCYTGIASMTTLVVSWRNPPWSVQTRTSCSTARHLEGTQPIRCPVRHRCF